MQQDNSISLKSAEFSCSVVMEGVNPTSWHCFQIGLSKTKEY